MMLWNVIFATAVLAALCASQLLDSPHIAAISFDLKKFANDDLWKLHVEKGAHQLCLMQATDKGAGFLMQDSRNPPSATSPWSSDLRNELKEWGWHESADMDTDEADFDKQNLRTTFDALKLNTKPKYDDDGDPVGGDNEFISLAHFDYKDYEDPSAQFPRMKDLLKQKYKVGDKEYSATGAYYDFVVNTKGGAIIGKALESPATAVKHLRNWGRPAQPGELPELRYCSDMYWGHWIRDNPNVKNLRVYGAQNVVNDATSLLVSRAFQNYNVEALTPWPGQSFEATTDEGKAIIGSPIGGTIAHMLIRHKAELGIKHITKVTVVMRDYPKGGFGSKYKPDVHLFFHIEDVPNDQIPQDGELQERLRRTPTLNMSNEVSVHVLGNNIVRLHKARL